MKIIAVGLGKAGGKIADKFIELEKWVEKKRGLQVVIDAFAVNTAKVDLSGLQYIPPEPSHRILIGEERAGGGGVGKLNRVGAEIAGDEIENIIDSIDRTVTAFEKVDAFLLIASTGGGTGSGAVAVVAQGLKEKYKHEKKPVYVMLISPFAFEKQQENQYVINTATCIKSVLETEADAVFLIDNERYIKYGEYAKKKGASSPRVDVSFSEMMDSINDQIVISFVDILCAGEEEKQKNVGATPVDIAEPRETFKGLTVFGFSSLEVAKAKFFARREKDDFRVKREKNVEIMGLLKKAISEISFDCALSDAQKVLVIIRASAKNINTETIEKIKRHLKERAPDVQLIRGGDYSRDEGVVAITVVFSGLTDVAGIKDFYSDSLIYLEEQKEIEKKGREKREEINEAGEEVPSLLTGKKKRR